MKTLLMKPLESRLIRCLKDREDLVGQELKLMTVITKFKKITDLLKN